MSSDRDRRAVASPLRPEREMSSPLRATSVLLASHDTDGSRAAERAALDAVVAGGRLHHLVIVPEFWQGMTGDGWRINASTEHAFCDYLEAQIEREIMEHLTRVNAEARSRGIGYSAGSKHGRLEDCLIAAAHEQAFDLVVIGARRPKGHPGLRSRIDLDRLTRGLQGAAGRRSASGLRRAGRLMTAAEQTQPPTGAHDDAAWVRIETSMSASGSARLHRRCRAALSHQSAAGDHRLSSPWARAAIGSSRSISRTDSSIDVALTVTQTDSAVEVAYGSGLKAATHFRVEAAPGGAHLVVTDIYGGGSADERRARAGEVDLSLNAWGRALHGYLGVWSRWRWLAPWRWYMRRVWQPMKPSARRIVWMILVISAFELFAIVVLLGVWVIVRSGPL